MYYNGYTLYVDVLTGGNFLIIGCYKGPHYWSVRSSSLHMHYLVNIYYKTRKKTSFFFYVINSIGGALIKYGYHVPNIT